MRAARPRLTPSTLPLWGVVWLAACAKDPEQARLAEIRRAWERNPDEAITLVNQLDELEQLAVIERVFEPWGGMGAGGTPCERLVRPTAMSRCKRIMSRVHLAFYRKRGQGDVDDERACLQRVGADLAQQDTPFGLAMAAAREGTGGDLEGGLAACQCLQEDRLRDECIFNLAETLARCSDIQAEAIDACVLLPQRVVPMCVEHTLSLASLRVGLASTSDSSWARVVPCANHIQRAPQWATQDHADGLLGFFWSYVMFESVAVTLDLPEDERVLAASLAEHMPAEALPHLRAAVAWAVLATTPEAERDADTTLEHIRAILAGTAPLPGAAGGPRPAFPMGCGMGVVPEEAGQILRHYLTRLADSRLGSADPEQDLALAVAAARACLDPARTTAGPGRPQSSR